MKKSPSRFLAFLGLVGCSVIGFAQSSGALPSSSAGNAEVAPSAGPVAPPAPPKVENGYLRLSFDHLASFQFVAPTIDDPAKADTAAIAKTASAQIPDTVKSWSGKKAALVGYMVPVKMEKGLVTEFLLMRNNLACCFGATPSITEWVVVKMKKGGVPATMDLPVEFFGELKVGPAFENGYISGIYQFDCERMGEVKS